MSEKLKPCPFCSTDLVENVPGRFEHQYNECTLEGHIVYVDAPSDVYRWNTRPDIRNETIEECAKVADDYDMPFNALGSQQIAERIRALKEDDKP